MDCIWVWGLKFFSFEELANGSGLQSHWAWQKNTPLPPYFSSWSLRQQEKCDHLSTRTKQEVREIGCWALAKIYTLLNQFKAKSNLMMFSACMTNYLKWSNTPAELFIIHWLNQYLAMDLFPKGDWTCCYFLVKSLLKAKETFTMW